MSNERHLDQHISALLIHLARQQGNSGKLSIFEDQLVPLLAKSFNVECPYGLLRDALSVLENLDASHSLDSPLTTSFIEIDSWKAAYPFGDGPAGEQSWNFDELQAAAFAQYPVLRAYFVGNQLWIDRVISVMSELDLAAEYYAANPYSSQIEIPASDRIVNLDHNAQSELIGATGDMIDLLDKENSIDGDAALRERFLAQLKAGRELVSVSSVKAYLVYETLVRMLGVLIAKYKDQVIAEAAKKLLDLLMQRIFGK